MEQQQTMFPFEDEVHRDFALPLEAEQRQRLIELMAQAIEAVVCSTEINHLHNGGIMCAHRSSRRTQSVESM